ncbi:MAG: sugar ABC transporter ATP-binding protein [Lachnospiraceae bacterium]|jgi:ribose transport system ATP-binding protein|nr:sugar ABC transporter ATP-binding protein [Lachnospiraceae bacterium]
MAAKADTACAVEMHDIVMEFSGVRALSGVEFCLRQGQIMGLVGKNGAGKSTLMKIINGVYTQTEGTVSFFGQNIDKNVSVKERERTVAMIYQDYSLVGEMTVAENIFLNAEPLQRGLISDRTCVRKVQEFFDSMGIPIDPREKVKNLSTGDMQLVEIAKAIMKHTKVILMDEPTAALDAEATAKFFEILSRLKEQGYSIVISTHHLQHIMDICDSVTIIRDGRACMTGAVAETTLEEVIAQMLGETGFQAVQSRPYCSFESKAPLLQVKNVTSKVIREPFSLEVRPGEVVGLAGLKGAGRTEIFNCIFGIDPPESGEVILEGKRLKVRNPGDAIRDGLFLIPENRHTQGLSLMHTLYDNALLPILENLSRGRFFINDRQGRQIVEDIIRTMQVKTPGSDVAISKLSGGNQQKVVVGKALKSEPKVLLMDDPTYGVDIHAKGDITAAISRFTDEGGGVLFVSSELVEMIENCDRILIVKYNRIVGEIRDVPKAGLTEDSLMAAIQ